jgi:hypothetical protein
VADGRSSVIALTPSGREQLSICVPRMRVAIRTLNGKVGGAAEADALRRELGRLDDGVRAAAEHLRRVRD